MAGMRQCPVCGKEFYDASRNDSKITCSNKCRDVLLYRDENKKNKRNIQMRLNAKKEMTVDTETLEQISADLQNGKCMLCGRDRVIDKNGRDNMAIDHDHVTGKYRGILCNQCNHALGNIGDNPFGALAIADYLIEHNAGGTEWKHNWLEACSIYLLTKVIIDKLQIDVDSIDMLLGIESQWQNQNSEFYQIINLQNGAK